MTTQEIADYFHAPRRDIRSILLALINGYTTDTRFQRYMRGKGVYIQDGRLFTYEQRTERKKRGKYEVDISTEFWFITSPSYSSY